MEDRGGGLSALNTKYKKKILPKQKLRSFEAPKNLHISNLPSSKYTMFYVDLLDSFELRLLYLKEEKNLPPEHFLYKTICLLLLNGNALPSFLMVILCIIRGGGAKYSWI